MGEFLPILYKIDGGIPIYSFIFAEDLMEKSVCTCHEIDGGILFLHKIDGGIPVYILCYTSKVFHIFSEGLMEKFLSILFDAHGGIAIHSL